MILIWFIASFFLLEVWDDVLLQGQMGDTYEGFINTRQDLIESNMTLGQVITSFMICCNDMLFTVLNPDSQALIYLMRVSQHEDYNKLADISLSLDNDPDWVKTDSLIDNEVMKHGTHAFHSGHEDIISKYSHLEEKHNTLWYRSDETVMSENPHFYWLNKKKWPLSEQLKLHMMNYQEV